MMNEPPRFTTDWFSNTTWAWEKYLPQFFRGSPVRWLEVGSYEGRSALWTLNNLLPAGSTITCVDHFDADYEMTFDANTRHIPAIVKARGKSHVVLPGLAPGFAGAYIDGSHEADDVTHDARAVWQLLLPGAPLVFDDYGMPAVHAAVDGFICELGRSVAVVFVGYQLFLCKLS